MNALKDCRAAIVQNGMGDGRRAMQSKPRTDYNTGLRSQSNDDVASLGRCSSKASAVELPMKGDSPRKDDAVSSRFPNEKCNSFQSMVCSGGPLCRIWEQMELVAPSRSTVLITGESGTGKELVARGIHRLSPRKNGRFVALNCAAIPKELAESELFGHSKGSFTGAMEARDGKFMAAHGGTLFIDEIGEMDLPMQAKLLRTLETRVITPVGSNDERLVDVRAVAATHRDLHKLTQEGRFREDLYYRLHVVHIQLPSLLERRDDIPVLAAAFLEQLNEEHARNVRKIAPDAMEALQSYNWPGNVRELHNLLEGVVALSRKELIELVDLPPEIRKRDLPDISSDFRPGMTLPELERVAIQACLVQTGGKRQRAAKLLGISSRTLLRKIRRFGLNDPLHHTTSSHGEQLDPKRSPAQ